MEENIKLLEPLTPLEPLKPLKPLIEDKLSDEIVINRNVLSSMLFIFPAIYAYLVLPPYSSVMIGSIICLITSVITHYYKTEHKLFRLIDVVTVNSIATYFILNAIFKIGNKFYANIMYAFAVIALLIYFYVLFNPDMYANYHCLIHICAITGIMFYIKAVKTYLYTPEKASALEQASGVFK